MRAGPARSASGTVAVCARARPAIVPTEWAPSNPEVARRVPSGRPAFPQAPQGLRERGGLEGLGDDAQRSERLVPRQLVMLAARPAPVQVSYLGYAHPLYLPWIDARISDLQADPPGASCAGGEAVYRLPTGYSYYCYAPPAGMPEVSSLPAKTRGYLTFGAFLQLGKLTPATVELWAGVLLAVPTSRLLIRAKGLGDKAVRDQVASALAGFGIARNRLQLEGWRSHDAHLRGYHEVDCMLDTTPFNLATNTCEALWMGVPTISLAGDRLSSRMGASILGAAGLADWVADDEDAFVKIACRAAGDLPWLAELRAGMRSQVAQSPLVDAEGYTRALEAIYRSLQGVAEARLSGGS